MTERPPALASRPVHRQGAPRVRRVVFLLPTFDVGGAERVVLRTASGLDRTRFDPVVVAFDARSGRVAQELRTASVPAHALGAGRGPLGAFWRLWRWLRANPCDLLVTFMFHANVAGRLLRHLAGVPILICSERIVEWEPAWRIAVNRATVGLADVVTTNSAAGVRFWAGQLRLPTDQVRLIYNGVDVTRFTPLARAPSGEVVLGNLARLHRKNGQTHLLAALAALAQQTTMPPWQCRIAGVGEEETALKALTQQLDIEDRVEFVGHVSAPERFLQSLDLYVHPSIAEGLPNAVLEAMATGLPVVATAVGGTAELVDNGVTGWLVEPGDTSGLCARVASLLPDPGSRVAAGAAGRLRVERHFSVQQMVQQTEQLFDELIARRAEV